MSEVYFFLLAGILHVELLQVINQLHLLANGALKLVLLQEMQTLARRREPFTSVTRNKTHGGALYREQPLLGRSDSRWSALEGLHAWIINFGLQADPAESSQWLVGHSAQFSQ